MIEPKIGEIFSLHGIKVKTCPMRDDEHCSDCAFAYLECGDIICYSISREDSTRVIFKEVEQTKIKPMEVKIQIPDNYVLIKDGDTYIVKEKKQIPPRSWEEFCERYPLHENEVYFDVNGEIRLNIVDCGKTRATPNWIINKQEAEAFLALMQLRQLRKAWIGNWKQLDDRNLIGVIRCSTNGDLEIHEGYYRINKVLSFPSYYMACDFYNCFKKLCETAKSLL